MWFTFRMPNYILYLVALSFQLLSYEPRGIGPGLLIPISWFLWAVCIKINVLEPLIVLFPICIFVIAVLVFLFVRFPAIYNLYIFLIDILDSALHIHFVISSVWFRCWFLFFFSVCVLWSIWGMCISYLLDLYQFRRFYIHNISFHVTL